MVLMSSPAANRNKVPIGEALQKYLNQAQTSRTSEHPRLLEIASGCGTHALYFSKLFEHVQWQPSDFQDECLASIQAHLSVDPRPNVDPPLKIDVCDPFDRWGLKHDQYDFVFNANMIHISPWRCTESLFANAGVVLRPGGLLFLYGPFAIDGVLEPKSNQEFNNSLMLNNPEWGIRDLRLVEAEASRSDITLLEVIDMPANNKLVKMPGGIPREVGDFAPMYVAFQKMFPNKTLENLKGIRALKILGFDLKSFVQFVEDNSSGKPRRVNEMLWNKMKASPEVCNLPISKSTYTDASIKFAKTLLPSRPKAAQPSNETPEVVDLSSDDEGPKTPKSSTDAAPQIPDGMQGSNPQQQKAAEAFNEFIWSRIKGHVTVRGTIYHLLMKALSEAHFRSFTFLAIYACDKYHMEKGHPSRVKDILYENLKDSQKGLPDGFNLEMLVNCILEFCGSYENCRHFFNYDSLKVYQGLVDNLPGPSSSRKLSLPKPVSAVNPSAQKTPLTSNLPEEPKRITREDPRKYRQSTDSSQRASAAYPDPLQAFERRRNESTQSASDNSVSPEHSIPHSYAARAFREALVLPPTTAYRPSQNRPPERVITIKRSPPSPTSGARRYHPSPDRQSSSSSMYRSPDRDSNSGRRRYSPTPTRGGRSPARSHHRMISPGRIKRSPSSASSRRHSRSPPASYGRRSPPPRYGRPFRRSRSRSPPPKHGRRSPPPIRRRSRSPPPNRRGRSRSRSPIQRGRRSRSPTSKPGRGPRTPPRNNRRSRSPSMRPPRPPSDHLDSKELGFGNSKGISQGDLKKWVIARDEMPNIMEGIVHFAEEAKAHHYAYSECNDQRVVLDFMKFLEKSRYTIQDVKSKAEDASEIRRLEDKLFDRKMKQSDVSADLALFKQFFEKVVEYTKKPYVSPYAAMQEDMKMSPKEMLKQVELFLDSVYGMYVEKRVCPVEFNDFHEYLNFSRQVRGCKYLRHQPVQVANDLIEFFREKGINMGELKKNRLSKIDPTELPYSCKLLFGALQSATQEFFIHKDASIKFCAIVDSQTLKQNEVNGLHSFLEYVVKCLLEEAYMMISNGELEFVAFGDINILALAEHVGKFTDSIIENGFTIYKAVEEFYQGSLNKFASGIVKDQECLDKDTAQKLITIWVGSLIKRRPLEGPPNSHKMRESLKRRVYVLIKAGVVVSKEISVRVQCNVSFPNIINQEMAKALHGRDEGVKAEVDEIFDPEDASWIPPLTKVEPKANPEPFIDSPGNVMITQKISIEGKRKVKCMATLCGIPRIRQLTPMKIWANASLYDDKLCRIFISDDRLVCGNQLMLCIGNLSDENVTLEPLTLVGHAMVLAADNPMALMAPLPRSMFSLKFLLHYFKNCNMTNVDEVDDGQSIQFGHGHLIKFNKKTKVNFKITYSEVLNQQNGSEFYTFDAIFFFLYNLRYMSDYKDYMAEALANRVPLVAHRDTFNLIGYMKEYFHKCAQIMHKDRAPVDEYLERAPHVGENVLEKYSSLNFPIKDIVDAISERYLVSEHVATARLTNLFTILDGMSLEPEQVVSDALKAGKTREVFEKTLGFEIIKHYRSNPDVFNECDPLFDDQCFPIQKPKPATKQECRDAIKFIAFAEEFIPDSQSYKSMLRKVEAGKEKAASLDLEHLTICARKIMENNLTSSKHEFIGLYISASRTTVAFILFVKPELESVCGPIIKMGSRLLTSCERMDIVPLKYAAAIKFAVSSCQDIFSHRPLLTIFCSHVETQTYFDEPSHMSYSDILARINFEFVKVEDQVPSGFLLVTRPSEPSVPNTDKLSHSYALSETVKAFLSIMLSRKKKQAFEERQMAKLLKLDAADKENMKPEEGESQQPSEKEVITDPLSRKGISEIKTSLENSWAFSRKLSPYAPLMNFVTRSFKANGADTCLAKFRANQVASFLVTNGVDYASMVESSHEGKLESFLTEKNMGFPDFIEDNETFINLILDHFSPALKMSTEGSDMSEDESVEDVDMDDEDVELDSERNILEDFFDEMERGDDSRRINQQKIEQKLLFVSMKKHFQVCLANEKQRGAQKIASDIVEAWVKCKCTPAMLKDVFENNILKGRKCITDHFEELLSKREENDKVAIEIPAMAYWTYDFFMARADSLCSESRSIVKHNDFRRKRLFQVQSDFIHMTTFKSLRCFYEILMKFHFKEESAPEVAKLCVETWIMLGFSYSQLQSLFTCAVSHQKTLNALLAKLTKMFDNASCLLSINARGPLRIDLRIMLEYTAMFFKTKALLGKRRLKSKNESLSHEASWEQIRKNILIMHPEKKAVYESIEDLLKKAHSPAALHFIMKEMATLSSGTHCNAFKFSLQAHLLMGNFDEELHVILKDVLMLLEKISISQEEVMEFEDGEVFATTTDWDSDSSLRGSKKKASKKKKVLEIPPCGSSDGEDFFAQQVQEMEEQFDLSKILDHEYATDDEFLWIDCNIRIRLSDFTNVCSSPDDVKYSIETILRFIELAHLEHTAYDKERETMFPNALTIPKEDREMLKELLGKELQVNAVRFSDDDLIRVQKEMFTQMTSAFKSELLKIQSKYPNRSYAQILESFYAHLFGEGMKCQRNWMAVASAIAEEMCDCWVNAKFNYVDLLKPVQEMSKIKGATAKRKKISSVYDNLIDGLVECIDLLPPGLRIHHITKFTMLTILDIVAESQ